MQVSAAFLFIFALLELASAGSGVAGTLQLGDVEGKRTSIFKFEKTATANARERTDHPNIRVALAARKVAPLAERIAKEYSIKDARVSEWAAEVLHPEGGVHPVPGANALAWALLQNPDGPLAEERAALAATIIEDELVMPCNSTTHGRVVDAAAQWVGRAGFKGVLDAIVERMDVDSKQWEAAGPLFAALVAAGDHGTLRAIVNAANSLVRVPGALLATACTSEEQLKAYGVVVSLAFPGQIEAALRIPWLSHPQREMLTAQFDGDASTPEAKIAGAFPSGATVSAIDALRHISSQAAPNIPALNAVLALGRGVDGAPLTHVAAAIAGKAGRVAMARAVVKADATSAGSAVVAASRAGKWSVVAEMLAGPWLATAAETTRIVDDSGRAVSLGNELAEGLLKSPPTTAWAKQPASAALAAIVRAESIFRREMQHVLGAIGENGQRHAMAARVLLAVAARCKEDTSLYDPQRFADIYKVVVEASRSQVRESLPDASIFSRKIAAVRRAQRPVDASRVFKAPMVYNRRRRSVSSRGSLAPKSVGPAKRTVGSAQRSRVSVESVSNYSAMSFDSRTSGSDSDDWLVQSDLAQVRPM